jgi:hypothetical protein
MPIASIEFPNPVNTSLQLGDLVYYSLLTSNVNNNFQTATTSSMVKLGVVVGPIESELDDNGNPLNPSTFGTFLFEPPSGNHLVNVLYDDAIVSPPTGGEYIMFEKDKQVNSSSLIGYYADVLLSNDSKTKIELFSLGSEVTESSK